MFKSIAEAHKEKQSQKKAHMKELETRIVDQSIPQLCDAVFCELSQGSDVIVNNQKEIDRKCKAVKDEWQKFNVEIGKWTSMINDLDNAVKEIGDIRSWSLHVQSQVQAAIEQLEAKQ